MTAETTTGDVANDNAQQPAPTEFTEVVLSDTPTYKVYAHIYSLATKIIHFDPVNAQTNWLFIVNKDITKLAGIIAEMPIPAEATA